MILSIWRYSHLALALISVLFVLMLSITGIILSFDPIDSKLNDFGNVSDYPDLSIAEVIENVKGRYSEVISISQDANGFIRVSAVTEDGDLSDFYINPLTGEKSGDLIVQSELMKFATNLHRSLFLKSTGRFIIGVSSFLLFLLTISGLILIIKRQQGLRNFFQKIVRENFVQYGHVYLGRIAIIPLIIISLTGVYLSMLRFDVVPSPILSHTVDYEKIESTPVVNVADFQVFTHSSIADLRSLEFPFSDDPIDYFQLSLQDREVYVNQYTGEILSEISYPMVVFLSEWNTVLHTGRGSIWWSLILGLSSMAILFFIYSGFKMTLNRRKGRIKNTYKSKESLYILLVGSETGTTAGFAKQFQLQLTKKGLKSHLAQLNDFENFPNMTHLVIFTATYGRGEAPANARRFIEVIQSVKITKVFNYAVVGFGSLAYPNFCEYALTVDAEMNALEKANRLLPVFTINSRSWEAFREWAKQWSALTEIPLTLPSNQQNTALIKKRKSFEVIEKTVFGDTFLLELKPQGKVKIKSGDLLAITPRPDSHERLYSIGLTAKKTLLTSVKIHNKGICSNYLYNLNSGDQLNGRVEHNPHFHFPKKAKRVLMISSGTGIAPFLGMLDENLNKVETILYWGGKTAESFGLYEEKVVKSINNGSLKEFYPAFSRESTAKNYVQDFLVRDASMVAETLKNKGVIMICGSMAMQKGVTKVINDICLEINNQPISKYQKNHQIKMDCY